MSIEANRRPSWVVLVAGLLVMLTAIWFVAQHQPIWAMPTTPIIVSGEGRNYDSCEAAALPERFDVQAARPGDTAQFSRDAALSVVDHMLARHFGIFLFASVYGQGPDLVRGTFAESAERLAWSKVVMLDDTGGGRGLPGRAAAAYVDATTGDPLALVTDVTVGDPQAVCITQDLSLAPFIRLLSTLSLIGAAALLLFAFLLARGQGSELDTEHGNGSSG